MNAPFRLYGAALSPYSLKVRSYLQFKGLDFEWLERNAARQDEVARFAKIPLAPILVDADDNVLQDTTATIEALEGAFPEPSITPDDPATAFLAALLEDYADEWLSKVMFHYRWSVAADQTSAAERLTKHMFEDASPPEGFEEAVKTRMEGRLHYVGASPENAPVLEASFGYVLGVLDRLLQQGPYLLGGRPSIADFAFAGQLAQLQSDPTPGALIAAQAPNVTAWIDRMAHPRVEGGFASFSSLSGDLAEVLRRELAETYLAWASANAQAVADDLPRVSVEIAGGAFAQKPQRYAAKSLGELKRKRIELADHADLSALLEASGCDRVLLMAGATEDVGEAKDGGDAPEAPSDEE